MSSSGPLMVGGGDAIGQDHPHTPDPYTPARGRRAATPAAPADLGQRLVIQEDARTGEQTYVVIDRQTGRVIARLPREAVAHMGDVASYHAGDLVKAKA